MLIIIVISLFTGCEDNAPNRVAGGVRISEFIADTALYESAVYTVTNLDSGEIEQTFTFCYDDRGRQVYLCEGVSEGTEGKEIYSEYSSGSELFREINGEVRYIRSNEPDYAAYTRERKHPYSSGELFFFHPAAVKESSETIADGKAVYRQTYDTEKLSKKISAGSAVSALSTEFVFDNEGNFLYFTESIEVGETAYSYRVDISDINKIQKIENPIDISSLKQSEGSDKP